MLNKQYKLYEKQIKTGILVIADTMVTMLVSIISLLLRFNFSYSAIPQVYLEALYKFMIPNIIIVITVFAGFKLYSSIWSFAGETEAYHIIFASGLVTIIVAFGYLFIGVWMPRSYYVAYPFLLCTFTLGTRFFYRWMRHVRRMNQKMALPSVNTMIIGAGNAGQALIREINTSKYLNKKICCIIDDNPYKTGKYIQGYKIVGNRDCIIESAKEYDIDEIIIAIPSASKQVISEILAICKETDAKLKTLPGMYQLINEEVSVAKLRDVEIEDLLGRESIKVDLDHIMQYIKGKTVMVTGGGGSIGSELSRQIAGHGAKRLVIVDIYENNAYDIQQELKHDYPELDLIVLIASVRNTHRIQTIMKHYKPEIVFHAAAHKHVPLMEDSPNEAIKNNVFGTYKTAKAAGENGVKRFVLISTDKAVNPTNIMGASKRLCEMVIQMMNNRYETEFVAVRFGNVLGSNGSVIPLFRKQIAQGGPVLVTHPDIIRYFMTIPEAVSLVLQAGAYAKGGEIFVLDMGQPVKILDLAKNLIRLSGYKVDKDIKIEFTGLRPGEKLYEELLMDEEGLQKTDNSLIYIGKPIEFDEKVFAKQLQELKALANDDSDEIKEKVKEIVPTYKIDEHKAE